MSVRGEANELLAHAFAFQMSREFLIHELRKDVKIAINASKESVVARHKEEGLRILKADAKMLGIPEHLNSEEIVSKFFGEEAFDGVVKLRQLQSASQMTLGLDCASIILTYSALEEICIVLLRITREMDRESWINLVSNKKVTIEELSLTEKEELISRSLDSYMESVIKRPLDGKVSLLISLTADDKPLPTRENSTYSEDRLKSFIELRHEMAHKVKPDYDTKGIDEEIKYIFGVNHMLIKLVEKKYGLAVDLDRSLVLWMPYIGAQPDMIAEFEEQLRLKRKQEKNPND